VKYHYSHRRFTHRVAEVRQAAPDQGKCEQDAFSPKPPASEAKRTAPAGAPRDLRPAQPVWDEQLWGHPLDGEFGWGGTPVK